MCTGQKSPLQFQCKSEAKKSPRTQSGPATVREIPSAVLVLWSGWRHSLGDEMSHNMSKLSCQPHYFAGTNQISCSHPDMGLPLLGPWSERFRPSFARAENLDKTVAKIPSLVSPLWKPSKMLHTRNKQKDSKTKHPIQRLTHNNWIIRVFFSFWPQHVRNQQKRYWNKRFATFNMTQEASENQCNASNKCSRTNIDICDFAGIFFLFFDSDMCTGILGFSLPAQVNTCLPWSLHG